MEFKEAKSSSKGKKELYVKGIKALIDRKQTESLKKRDEYAKGILKNPEKYRQELKNILGWPLTDNVSNQIPDVKSEKLFEKETYNIYRMSFEVLEDVWLTGILIKHDNKKRPLILAQHGALGSPELISGFYGSTSNYNDFVERMLKYDVNIFAPQLLIWDEKEYEIEFCRALLDSKLKRVGGSITAVEIFGLMRILDYFENQDYVKNFGMAGLSYGGYYTMLMAAIDTRIKSAVSSSFFCSGNVLKEFCDIYFFDLGNKMSWAEIMMLVYPRQICLAIGDNDSGFPYKESIKEFNRLENLCKEVGNEWVDFIVFKGEHEFLKDDIPLERMTEHLKMIVKSTKIKQQNNF